MQGESDTAAEAAVAGSRLQELVDNLQSPRKIMMMVKAGPAVDALIEELIPLLSPGDILIDGGNTHFADTNRRTKRIEEAGLQFIGTGVSGGEEGAGNGGKERTRRSGRGAEFTIAA